MACEFFNITCLLHSFLIMLVPKTWLMLAHQVNQISISLSGWLFLLTLPNRHMLLRGTAAWIVCTFKGTTWVTKALFQKDGSRKWRIRIPPPGKRTPLGPGIKDAVGRMGLDSWIRLPKWSFSVFGTQARPQPDTPCSVALEFLTEFGTVSASN